MTQLETAVRQLAAALDTLEGKLEERLSDLANETDTVDAARRQARAARAHAGDASDTLAAAIGDLKALLAEDAGDETTE